MELYEAIGLETHKAAMGIRFVALDSFADIVRRGPGAVLLAVAVDGAQDREIAAVEKHAGRECHGAITAARPLRESRRGRSGKFFMKLPFVYLPSERLIPVCRHEMVHYRRDETNHYKDRGEKCSETSERISLLWIAVNQVLFTEPPG